MKMAHLMFVMDDGGSVAAYVQCVDDKGLYKDIKKRLKGRKMKLGSVQVKCAQVVDWGYSIEGNVQ